MGMGASQSAMVPETYNAPMTDPAALRALIVRDGFAFVPAMAVAPLLGPLADWEAFAASWNELPRDTHLPDGHRYRRRRHATLSARGAGEGFRVEPHQPHYQSRDYNQLNGGIARWFEPVDETIGNGATMRAILRFTRTLFEGLAAASAWHVEVHQFRIAAVLGEQGKPTPEGVHRDGVDYVLVLLVERHNIAKGTTTVHRLNGDELGSFTLESPLDAALLDDSRVAHGVTPIEPVDPAAPAYRDVLVVTWRDILASHPDAGVVKLADARDSKSRDPYGS